MDVYGSMLKQHIRKIKLWLMASEKNISNSSKSAISSKERGCLNLRIMGKSQIPCNQLGVKMVLETEQILFNPTGKKIINTRGILRMTKKNIQKAYKDTHKCCSNLF